MSKQIELENPDSNKQIDFIGRLGEDAIFITEKLVKQLLNFHKMLQLSFELSFNYEVKIKMEAQKIDTAENLDITMPMYNLIEYSDSYSDTSRSLW